MRLRRWLPRLPAWLQVRLQLARVERDIDAIYEKHEAQLAAARTDLQRAAARHHLFHQTDHLELERVKLRSQQLERRAERWEVELPQDAFACEEDHAEPGAFHRFISDSAQQRVRCLIRDHRNARVLLWLKVAGGVIAAVAGIMKILG